MNIHEEFYSQTKELILELLQFLDQLQDTVTANMIAAEVLRNAVKVGRAYLDLQRPKASFQDDLRFYDSLQASLRQIKFWIETLIDARKCSFQQGAYLWQELVRIQNELKEHLASFPSGEAFREEPIQGVHS